jgi:4a-hydroxytetrahydrobiopterin dehydratase
MSELVSKHCVPCEGGLDPLSHDETTKFMSQVPEWMLSLDGLSISRSFKFSNYVTAIEFANKLTPIAEAEGHHPDLFIGWGKVVVTLTTHAIKGLSENDFILAAKIDEI